MIEYTCPHLTIVGLCCQTPSHPATSQAQARTTNKHEIDNPAARLVEHDQVLGCGLTEMTMRRTSSSLGSRRVTEPICDGRVGLRYAMYAGHASFLVGCLARPHHPRLYITSGSCPLSSSIPISQSSTNPFLFIFNAVLSHTPPPSSRGWV
ncbi:hypothetical protein K474DRAFT_542469 [Panus rudis PR-1116 ss-1]|nr:hypothetical protein K474DRAFT_542469 [Panus rudis PR-1116 ss-1]